MPSRHAAAGDSECQSSVDNQTCQGVEIEASYLWPDTSICGSVADEVVRGATVPTFVYRPERAGHGVTEGEHGADIVAAARER